MNKFDSEEAERTSKFYVMFGNKLDSLVNEMKKKARSNDTSSKAAEVAMAIYAAEELGKKSSKVDEATVDWKKTSSDVDLMKIGPNILSTAALNPIYYDKFDNKQVTELDSYYDQMFNPHANVSKEQSEYLQKHGIGRDPKHFWKGVAYNVRMDEPEKKIRWLWGPQGKQISQDLSKIPKSYDEWKNSIASGMAVSIELDDKQAAAAAVDIQKTKEELNAARETMKNAPKATPLKDLIAQREEAPSDGLFGLAGKIGFTNEEWEDFTDDLGQMTDAVLAIVPAGAAVKNVKHGTKFLPALKKAFMTKPLKTEIAWEIGSGAVGISLEQVIKNAQLNQEQSDAKDYDQQISLPEWPAGDEGKQKAEETAGFISSAAKAASAVARFAGRHPCTIGGIAAIITTLALTKDSWMSWLGSKSKIAQKAGIDIAAGCTLKADGSEYEASFNIKDKKWQLLKDKKLAQADDIDEFNKSKLFKKFKTRSCEILDKSYRLLKIPALLAVMQKDKNMLQQIQLFNDNWKKAREEFMSGM